jgi:hypothetical protein
LAGLDDDEDEDDAAAAATAATAGAFEQVHRTRLAITGIFITFLAGSGDGREWRLFHASIMVGVRVYS